MIGFGPGDEVAITCELQPGAFPGEFLVILPTRNGPVSGFVKADQIVGTNGERSLYAVVRAAEHDYLRVWLSGSFFTTTGLADLSNDWAIRHVRRLPSH